ncbi:MAG: proline racemase family protein [Candidatus Promineifilaceae bacterium]
MGKRLVITADSHTQGEPTRLVIGGIIHFPGETMREKQLYAALEYDDIRRSLMGEPRGHYDMFGGFITPPVSENGHLGILYMDNVGYLDMCGHGTIGLCRTVVELGMVEATPPHTEIRIDTPVGQVIGFAQSENGRVLRSGFQNVPAFCLHERIKLAVAEFGEVEVGVAYGGNFFAILPAEAVGLDICFDNMNEIRRVGMMIKEAANEQMEVRHPKIPEVSGIDIVTFYGRATVEEATYKNVHVFANGQVDRSPGGTGTSAVLAYFIARGELEADKVSVAEGLAGGLFEGRIVKSWEEDGLTYHIPEISGVAYLTGINHFVLDPDDPMMTII